MLYRGTNGPTLSVDYQANSFLCRDPSVEYKYATAAALARCLRLRTSQPSKKATITTLLSDFKAYSTRTRTVSGSIFFSSLRDPSSLLLGRVRYTSRRSRTSFIFIQTASLFLDPRFPLISGPVDDDPASETDLPRAERVEWQIWGWGVDRANRG